MSAICQVARKYPEVYGWWVFQHKAEEHHLAWLREISEVWEGRSEKRKLLIVAPPGSAKSTWLSLIAPSWYLGNHPDHSIAFLTASDTNAYQFGNTVKDVAETNVRHIATFPKDECRPDKGRGWSSNGLYFQGTPKNAKDPSYRALGFGSAAIGARAHGLIIDDPLTQQQAESPIEQANARRYYDMTLDTRLHPTEGWVIAIMTRWHEGDLAAYFAEKDDWKILHTPAIIDIGTSRQRSIWPVRFPLSFFLRKYREDPATFSCVYQGDPRAMGGQVFKSGAWFRPITPEMKVPDREGRSPLSRLKRVQYWDLAWTKRETSDYTASVTMSFDKDYNGFVTHAWHGRFDAPLTDEPIPELNGDVLPTTDSRKLDDVIVEQIEAHRPDIIGIEIGAFKQAPTKDFIRRVAKRVAMKGIAVPIVGITQTRDKVLNARLPASRAENGMIYVDREAMWYPTFENECLIFPKGKNDDIVDAFSGACQLGIERISTLPDKPSYYTFNKNESNSKSWVEDALAEGDVRVVRRS